LSRLSDLLTYGEHYLSADEREKRLQEIWNEYYVFLAMSAVVERRNADFWAFHKRRLNEMGHKLDRMRLGKIISKMAIRVALNPELALRKVMGHKRTGLRGVLAGGHDPHNND
jgi:hypothetical protein